MNNLADLIRELSPKGVVFKRVGDIASIGTGSSNGNEAQDDGNYPFYIRSQTVKRKNDWEFDEEAIIIPGEGGIGDIYHYVNGKYALHQRVYRIHFTADTINAKFAYYYFTSQFKGFIMRKAVSATVTSIRKPMIEDFRIPLPPLNVQEEIVYILDSFTDLTAELNAELTARKKQYEFYRNLLLTHYTEFRTVELKDACTFVRGPFGGSLKKDSFQPRGFAVYEQQNAIYKNLEFRYYISDDKYRELRRFSVHPGDMIVSCSGTIGKTYVIPPNAPEGIINQALLKLTPNDDVDILYMQFFFENTISKLFNSISRGGAIKNVPSVDELKAIKMPLPSKEVQKRLVDVLSNFDAICTDLNIGLPAEIHARKKQYEYYRDALLTFPDVSDVRGGGNTYSN